MIDETSCICWEAGGRHCHSPSVSSLNCLIDFNLVYAILEWFISIFHMLPFRFSCLHIVKASCSSEVQKCTSWRAADQHLGHLCRTVQTRLWYITTQKGKKEENHCEGRSSIMKHPLSS